MASSHKLKQLILMFLFSLMLVPVHTLGASTAELKYTTASLHSEYSKIDGKQNIWLMFQLDIRKDWHTYWKNPGDSGLAPRLKWVLPENVTAGPIQWQPPSRFPIGPLMNYGYA